MKLWEIRQQAEAPESRDLYIYSAVEGDGYDWWTGEKIESNTSAEHFRQELEKYKDVKQINLYINSLGGSVMEGVCIYNQLRRHPANVTAYIDGFACSIASVIAMAADKIVMPKNAVMMIHNAWTLAVGNANELRKAADDLDVLNEASRRAYLVKAGDKLDEKQLTKMLEAETYLTAEQCIQYGLADEYSEKDINIEAAKQALSSAKNAEIKQYANRVEKACALAGKIELKAPETKSAKSDLAESFMQFFK